MANIDHRALRKAMDLAGFTPAQLAEATGISYDYMLNIRAGHRRLGNNPQLRRKLAVALNVPTHWIEHRDSEVAA